MNILRKNRLSQLDKIRIHLERDSITPLTALRLYRCMRLADVVFRLKKEGLDIITEIKEGYNEDGAYRYAEYHIRKVEK